MHLAPSRHHTSEQAEHHRGAAPEHLGVDEAGARVLAAFRPLEPVEVPLDDALGLVTAAAVQARQDLPPFDNSAMDGFALRVEGTTGASEASPARLRVIGNAPAGHRSDTDVAPGTAMRIMTGAPVPIGADAVIRFEHVIELEGDHIAIPRPVRPAENIRRAGEDARSGQDVMPAGTCVRPNEIALLAGSGHATVTVHRRPRVGVLVTGDEVVPPGEPLAPGQIWNSNGPMIAAQVRQAGGEPVSLGVASDATEAVRAKLAAIDGLDLLVTTGGISVGDFDVVKQVLLDEGRIDLWRVRMKPGGPLAFGRIGATPVIGLPGNPVAAAVASWQFVGPAIRTMLGHAAPTLRTVQACLEDRIENRGGRRQFVRVALRRETGTYIAALAGSQGSHMLTSLMKGNGLLIIPEACPVAEPGSVFPVQMFDAGA